MAHGFDFIDLFAGIGGIRIGLESAGGRCVFTSEWNKYAQKTYRRWFADDDDHHFEGDITGVAPDSIPDHDLLAGGFPCQPFSIAGVSKKNALGRKHGFEDPTQGTLFFNVKEILLAKRPRAFLLENVKNLKSHDRGNTWRVIEASLAAAGYAFGARVLDAKRVAPQHRERVFIVGFDRQAIGAEPDWDAFWQEVDEALEAQAAALAESYGIPFTAWPVVDPVLQSEDTVDERYVLSDKLWTYLQRYKAKHAAKGNGFGYGLVRRGDACTRTISARYYKDGAEALVERRPGVPPRRLTPLECARLQGFPRGFQQLFANRQTQPVSDTQAYKQFGNSVCVPVVSAVAGVMARRM